MSQYFIDPKELPAKTIAPGSQIQVACGEKLMFSFVQMEPGSLVPRHSHPHEQGGVCLAGTLELTIGGESRTLRAGQGWMIPGGVEHSARGLDGGAFVLDVFYPHREEYK